MKLNIKHNQINNFDAAEFLLRNGYARIFDRLSNKESFVRRMGSYFYPRFHVYVMQNNDGVTLDMHIDQKKTSYAGSHMHNAEYDGDLVSNEMTRLHNIVDSIAISGRTDSIEREVKPAKKSDRSWLKDIFS